MTDGFDDDTFEVPAVLGVGLHHGIPPAVYHRDPCARPSLSSSIATTLLDRSPAHAKLAHAKIGVGYLESDEETEAMSRGTLLHRLVLGRGADVVAVDAKDWRTNKAKEERERIEQAGGLPVLVHKLRNLELASEVIRANLGEFGIDLAPRDSELVAVWEEPAEHGVPVLCRGLLDNFDEETATIYDPKFTADASPAACVRRIAQMGYAMQAAAYTSGVERLFPSLAGRVKFVFLFCEPVAPYAVTPVTLSGDFREYGARRWKRAVNLWGRCLGASDWPLYTREVVTVEPPTWLLSQDMGEQLAALENADDPI